VEYALLSLSAKLNAGFTPDGAKPAFSFAEAGKTTFTNVSDC